MSEPGPLRATLRAYAAALLTVTMLALATRAETFAIGRTGAAILAAWHGGFLAAPLAAAALAAAALWATRALYAKPLAARGAAARRGQGVRVPLAMAAILLFLARPAAPVAAAPDLILLGAALCALAFPALIAERVFARAPRTDAADLRALLLLPVLAPLLCGLSLIGFALGFGWAALPPLAGRVVVGAVCVELAARALGRWFLPPPAPDRARPATASLLAAILAGVFGGDAGAPVRAQTGLDFSRSFALRYLRAAALPGAAGLLLAGFALSGLKQVPVTGRAVYERLGDPVRVLQPGLHVILPWPLGRLRRTELDVVHSLPIGDGAQQAQAAPPDAEAVADLVADRLWSGTHPNEAAFLIASRTGFQVISADLRVLWRIGASDADARAAVYADDNPEALLRVTAARVLTEAFAARTLDDVLGAPDALRSAAIAILAADEHLRRAGIETLDLVVEAVHPPADAAAAYHAVQAAGIGSRTEVAVATRAAHAARNTADGEARTRTDAAAAHAAEIAGGAAGDATKFAAERDAAREGPSFLLERRLTATAQSTGTAHLTLVDPSLPPQTVDLRPEGRVPATVQTED